MGAAQTVAKEGELTSLQPEKVKKFDPEKAAKNRSPSVIGECFRLAVYFPKFVCINNTRLTLMYYVLTVFLILFIAWYFIAGSSTWLLPKFVSAAVHVCGTDGARCGLPQTSADFLALEAQWDQFHQFHPMCQPATLPNYRYWQNASGRTEAFRKLNPHGCAEICGRDRFVDACKDVNGNAVDCPIQNWKHLGACVTPDELISVTNDIVFIPTYSRRSLRTPKDANGNCDPSMMHHSGHCVNTVEQFIPAAEHLTVSFFHEISASPEVANMFIKLGDKKAGSMKSEAEGFGAGLKTVWFSENGTVIKEYANEWISPTIDELLKSASYEDRGPSGMLTLDQSWNTGPCREDDCRVPENGCKTSLAGCPLGVNAGPTLRQTGVTITVDLITTDSGECNHKEEKEKYLKVSHDGPVACMFVYAERMWTYEGHQYPVGTDGSYWEVMNSGIRIKFRTGGEVRMLELTEVSQSFTVAVVWIQIPLVVVYYFTVLFLGHLSSVYGTVLHQTLNLGAATKGLATRLVSHSAAYMDLQDDSEGITKGRMHARFNELLKSNDSLDAEEIKNYVSFVFEGMQSMGEGEVVINDTVNIEEFCEACASNEPLSFDMLTHLFDKDRVLSKLEYFFLDDTIRGVVKSASQGEDDIEELDADQAALAESVVVLSDIQDKVGNLEKVCKNILATADEDLSVDRAMSNRAAAIAFERKNVEGKTVIDPILDFVPTEDPKPDQRESACSVLDEEEPGRVASLNDV